MKEPGFQVSGFRCQVHKGFGSQVSGVRIMTAGGIGHGVENSICDLGHDASTLCVMRHAWCAK
jgi:hypothetical protein